MDLGELTLNDFLSRLGSAAPVPGGGSLAAVAGAQAAAMLAMCCNLTLGRARYADIADEVAALLDACLDTQHELLGLANRDVAAYAAVRDAYRLPRVTEAEKDARSAAIELAMHTATEVPVQAAEAARRILGLAVQAARTTNVTALGDVSVATHLALGAARGAADQATLNLTGLTDPAFATVMRGRIERALDGASDEAEEATTTVSKRWTAA